MTNSREYWFTAWLNPFEGGLWIQDISIPVDNNPGADIIKEYPVVGYLSVFDRFIEYRVIKSDIGFDLKDGCINLVAVILGVHDFTDSILIE